MLRKEACMPKGSDPRNALIRNASKVGFSPVEGFGDAFEVKDLRLVCNEGSEWSLMKGGKQISSGKYGRTQMQEVRRAVAKEGVELSKISVGGRAPLTEKQKADRKEKMKQTSRSKK
jgi:hypothetical protein